MNRPHPNLTIYTLAASVFLLLAGCSSAPEQSRQAPDPNGAFAIPRNPDAALQYFTAGLALESGGNARGAVREFTRALMFDGNPAVHDALVRCYASLGEDDNARVHAVQALALDSGKQRYVLQLAEMYLSAHLLDSARFLYERAYATDSSDTHTLIVLARLYETSDHHKAIEAYQRYQVRMGPDLDSGFRLAQLYASKGRIPESLALLERLNAAHPRNDMLLQSLGGLYMRTGSFDKAVDTFTDLCAVKPDEAGAQLLLAEALLNARRWDEAARIFFPLVGDARLGAEDRMAIGKIYFQQALRDNSIVVEAMQVFTKLKEQFPRDWRPVWFAGAVYYNEGALGEAITRFEQVVHLVPANVEALDVLARAYVGMQRYGDARRSLRTIIGLGKASAETWGLLGYVCALDGDSDAAKDAYRSALDADASRMDILSSLALLHDAEGDLDASGDLYSHALQWYSERSKDATYYQLLNNYAYALCEHDGDLDRALELSREAVSHDEDNSSFLDTIGWIYFRMERYETALTYVRRAVELRLAASQQPGPVLYEHLGDIHRGLGNTEAALRSWQQALAADPQNNDLRNKIERLTHD